MGTRRVTHNSNIWGVDEINSSTLVVKRALDRGSTFGIWLLHSIWKGGRASLALIHPLNLSCAGSKRHTPGPRLSRRAKPREAC